MAENINTLIKPVQRNGAFVTHELSDTIIEASEFCSSTYIQNENILVKGQCQNPLDYRGALLVFFDLNTGKVRGGSNMFLLCLTKRLWRNHKPAKCILSGQL